MSNSEFDLIREYFQYATEDRDDVVLGIGDDCALLELPAGKQLAISMDTLVSGRHFLSGVEPESLGHKALAVNLSDLAAMGAQPAWVTLSMTMPGADAAWREWLADFMRGFSNLAAQHQLQLVGGDTTRGDLSITVQVHGFLDSGTGLRRDAAQEGDQIYVTGTLGDAGLALLLQQNPSLVVGDPEYLADRLNRPAPRVAQGRELLIYARAAIDISDGLIADLRHVCVRSAVGATVYLQELPLSTSVRTYVHDSGSWTLPLSAGDDYELVFTVPPEKQAGFVAAAAHWDLACTWIGTIETNRQPGQVRVVLPDGQIADEETGGYDHFSA